MTGDEHGRARFAAAYTAHVRAVLGYALRRVEVQEDAADVVAETFVVAWRRWGEVPPDEVRPWLLGVARRVLANQQRSHRRRERLGARLRDVVGAAVVPDPADGVADRDRLGLALGRLSAADRELLTLVAWEELTPTEAAQVLGIAAGTARMRLSRARERFEAAWRATGDAGDRSGHHSPARPVRGVLAPKEGR